MTAQQLAGFSATPPSPTAPPRVQLRREEVPEAETWDLTHLFDTPEAWAAELKQIDADLPAIARFKGRLTESPATLLAALRERDALLQRLDRVGTYASLRSAADGASAQNQAMSAQAQALAARADAALTFIESEVVDLPDGFLEEFLTAESQLSPYRRLLESLHAQRAHRLEPETEEVLAALGNALHAPSTIRTRALAADLQIPPAVDERGNEVQLSIARAGSLLQSPDREVRRRAHEAVTAALTRHKATLAETLATMLRRNVTLARLRRFPSAVDMILDSYEVPRPVYENVLHIVHDEGAPHVRRLMRLRARLLGLERLAFSDLFAPLDPGYSPPATFEGAQPLIREALAALGPECQEIVDTAFRDRWIDRADNVGKRNGAFCSGVYGVHPYVFLTWTGRMRGVFTVAHELGHALNDALSARHLPYAQYSSPPGRSPLFWVEAPSTANEMLLGHNVLSTTDDPRVRRFVTLQFLGTFFHNMTTHLLEAHFEHRLYQLAEAGTPITVRTVMDVQGEVFERYYGDTVEIDDGARLYWMQVGHFYRGLYPVTYSAGLACAHNAVEAIRTEGQPAVDRWLAALSAGRALPSLGLMRLAGVDLADPETIRRAVALYGHLVDDLEHSFAAGEAPHA